MPEGQQTRTYRAFEAVKDTVVFLFVVSGIASVIALIVSELLGAPHHYSAWAEWPLWLQAPWLVFAACLGVLSVLMVAIIGAVGVSCVGFVVWELFRTAVSSWRVVIWGENDAE